MHDVEIHEPVMVYEFMAVQSAESARRAYDERHIAQEVSGDLKQQRRVTEGDRIQFERGLMGWWSA